MLPQVKLETCTDEELEKYLKRLNKVRIDLIEEMETIKSDQKDSTHDLTETGILKKEYDQEIDRVIRYLTATRIKKMKSLSKLKDDE